jgi:Zn-dependent protease
MFKKREIISIIVAILIISISISIITSWQVFAYSLFAIFLVFSINILAKKMISYYLDTEIEMKLWEIKRYGFSPKREFKRAMPAGVIMPIIFSLLSKGNLMWLASLVFDIKPKIYRAAKRHGLYSFSEVTEYQIGLIAAIGVLANLIFAVVGYLCGWPLFARLNIWLAFFSMIPVSDLDGNKIFFGNLVIWSFLASITLIGMAYMFLLI